jgi:two-component system phosphate regulon sensor histidine kinase PhoR
MSKKWIWILSSFMAVAMTGLIFFQIYWVKNAVNVKERQFNQLINKALFEIAYEIQKREAVNFIIDEINPFYFDTTSGLYDTDFKFEQDFYFYRSSSGENYNANISVYSTDTFIIIDKDKKNTYSETANNNQNISGKKYQLTPNLKKRILDKQVFVNNVLSKMFRFNPDIENRLNPKKLEKIIRKVLNKNGVDLDFEYAVTKWNTIPAYTSRNYCSDADSKHYKVQLFSDDFFSKSNFLTIYFPLRKNFIYKSLGFMALSSIILTLMIVISFTFTIYIIIRQKRLSEIRSDFVNNMTHELKTPISTISLASQMLGDKSIPNESKNIDNLSAVITDESRRLGFQVEKVLQTAIFNKGKLKLKLKEANIHEIITSVINNFSIQIKKMNGLIIPSLHAENPVLFIDVVHITNVLSNLIDNAIKYCTQDPEIYIETQNSKGYLIIIVRDNGIGISQKEQKHIFEKFYRISTGNIHSVKGFGLGLSYVKKVIEEHKGYIKLESEPYQGTVFKLFLPG